MRFNYVLRALARDLFLCLQLLRLADYVLVSPFSLSMSNY